jgi:hypothetical protein
MALSGSVLGANIADAITDPNASPEAAAAVKVFWTKIANEIVKHIVDNAVVTVETGIAVSTTGTETAQTGQTTSEGTGTVA